MATDLEKLVVQLSADIKQYQREMNKAVGVSNQQARQIENRFRKMNQNLDSIGGNAARSLIAPLGAISAALSVREVARYADAWTGAKNSLAVAGVVGAQQADVLERLYQAAQANNAPVTALATLYGRAAQASDRLGASQNDLVRFAAGVGTALRVAGTSATQAQGALTQLGQAISSTRVFAEEFNSVNEGARPILIAVAAGLDKAGGSVSKLRQLVIDGEVSGKEFFDAFLRGLPKIQNMAANATTTIDQGLTKVNNAFTKYIGSTDESLGASQRLVAGLSALADNFDEVADVTLKVAGIIAGALVGRSIGAMVAKLGLAATAATKFISAIRAATALSGVATAISGISAAAGPIGLVLGGTAVAALTIYSAATDDARAASSLFEKALEGVAEKAEKTADRVESAAEREAAARRHVQEAAEISAAVDYGQTQISDAQTALDNLARSMRENSADFGWAIPESVLDSFDDLTDRIRTGDISAGELDATLENLAASHPNLGAWISEVGRLARASLGAARAVGDLKTQLAAITLDASTPELSEQQIAGYQQYGASRREGDAIAAAGKAYVAEAQRRNALSKQTLAIEDEIAKVRKKSLADGVTLTDQQIRQIAEGNVAASARRTEEGKSGTSREARALERYDDRTMKDIEGMKAEAAALRELGPVYDEYGNGIERARLEAELLQDLQNKGVKLTPELRAQVKGLARDWQQAADENSKARKTYEEFQQVHEDVRSAAGEAFGSMIEDVRNFGDVLSNLVSRLQTILTNRLFDQLWEKMVAGGGSGGGGGGLLNAFSSWFGGFRANGGGVQAGRAYVVGEKRPELFVPGQSGMILPSVPSGRSGGGNSVQIIDQRTAAAPPIEQQTQRDPSGREMTRFIVRENNKGVATGMADSSMNARFGVRNKMVKR